MIVANAVASSFHAAARSSTIVRPDRKQYGRQNEWTSRFRQCRDHKHDANQHCQRVATGAYPACNINGQQKKHAERRLQQGEAAEEKSKRIGGDQKCSEAGEGLRLILTRDRVGQQNTQADASHRQRPAATTLIPVK